MRLLAAIAFALATFQGIHSHADTESERPAIAGYVRYLVREAGNPKLLARNTPARRQLVSLLANQQIPRHVLSAIVRNVRVRPLLARSLAAMNNLDGAHTSSSLPGLELVARHLANAESKTDVEYGVSFLESVAASETVSKIQRFDGRLRTVGAPFILGETALAVRPPPRFATREKGTPLFTQETDRPGMRDYLNGRISESPLTTQISLEPLAEARQDFANLLTTQRIPWAKISRIIRNANLSSHIDRIARGLASLNAAPTRVVGLNPLIDHLGRTNNSQTARAAAFFFKGLGEASVVKITRINGIYLAERPDGSLLVSALDKSGESKILEGATRLASRYPKSATRDVTFITNIPTENIPTSLSSSKSKFKSSRFTPVDAPTKVDIVARLEARVQKSRVSLQQIEAETSKLQTELREENPEARKKATATRVPDTPKATVALTPKNRERLLTREANVLARAIESASQKLQKLKGTAASRRVPRQQYLWKDYKPKNSSRRPAKPRRKSSKRGRRR